MSLVPNILFPPETSLSSLTMSRTADRLFSPALWLPLIAGAGAGLLYSSATAREVAGDSVKLLFVLVSTPFFLEATCAVTFFIGLLAYNHWRLKKDGDGWVYIVDQEAEDSTLPKALTERLHNVVLTEKPETLDETTAQRSVIEGYLELGMGAQALADFNTNSSWPDDAATASLRVRVLAANMDTERAAVSLADAATRFPDERSNLARTALEVARWTKAHLHRAELVERWFNAARALDSEVGAQAI